MRRSQTGFRRGTILSPRFAFSGNNERYDGMGEARSILSDTVGDCSRKGKATLTSAGGSGFCCSAGGITGSWRRRIPFTRGLSDNDSKKGGVRGGRVGAGSESERAGSKFCWSENVLVVF